MKQSGLTARGWASTIRQPRCDGLKYASIGNRRRTAIHEAGHAVMHYLERVPFESVTIVPDPVLRADGAVHPCLGPVWLWDRQRPKTIRICMGGRVAEEFFTGHVVTRGCAHDLDLAACIADELSNEPDRVLSTAYVAAPDKLTAPSTWAAVLALASALIERQRLSKRQAYRVIRGVLPKTGFEGRGRAARYQRKKGETANECIQAEVPGQGRHAGGVQRLLVRIHFRWQAHQGVCQDHPEVHCNRSRETQASGTRTRVCRSSRGSRCHAHKHGSGLHQGVPQGLRTGPPSEVADVGC
ncbi:MAG: hypothetical protein HYZ57_06205 [Acidobacteria bacterium]|nr:hypothetical protein [Acidobacteriota bacterium]